MIDLIIEPGQGIEKSNIFAILETTWEECFRW